MKNSNVSFLPVVKWSTSEVLPMTFTGQGHTEDFVSAKIEITPAMIEAGLAAYYYSDSRFDLDEEIVRSIFLRMLHESKYLTKSNSDNFK